MRAAVITGKQQVELIELERPAPQPGGVVVDISLCGICGTDVHAYQSGAPYNPAICGHEWVGTVSAVATDVRSTAEGDRVVVAVPPPCGRCAACRSGHPHQCVTVFLSATGRDVHLARHGGFAVHLGVAADRVVAAHPLLSDTQAAQVEPATVALHAVRRSGLRLGDVAVVQGAGPIGLTTLQWVRAGGAAAVIVIEPNAARRELALTLGATAAVTPEEADDAVRERTGGLGADIVYECVGRAFAIQAAVDHARRGGSMCLIGLSDTDASIVPAVWLVKEIAVTASLAYSHEEFAISMDMIVDGRVRLDPLHTATVGLAGLDAALAELAAAVSPQIKILVDPRLP